MGAVVVLERLTKRYGTRPALADVDLEIAEGEIFGYLGPNGAGKTTTMRILLGLLRASSGSARVFGLDCWRDGPAIHRRVGYVPGEPSLYPRMTGHDLTRYLGNLRGRYDAAEVAALADMLDVDLDRPIRALSHGNRQKVALVQAFMGRPDLLVLDEPASGLDPLVQVALQRMLREHTDSGGTVLLSSHVLSEVQRTADRVGMIREGRVIAVESLASLRATSLHHVVVQFVEPVDPTSFARLPGVRELQVHDHTLTCEAPASALDELVKQCAHHHVLDLTCEEASLDETFLAFYGNHDDAS